jgi:hypothetical protein
MTIDRIERALRETKELQSQLDNAKGQRDAALSQLKAKYEVSSLGEAREKVAKLRRKLTKQEAEAAALLDSFYSTYGEML